MNFLLSGYYGYDNAGDEAVLAAMLEHLSALAPPKTRFTITSGDPSATIQTHAGHNLTVIGRQNPRALTAAIRACDVFISGGGSLLQDVTSLRNVAYYTGLLRIAQLARKPTMFYAQGVGPLRHQSSRVLARAAVSHCKIITVRDEASRALLEEIGVRKKIEVTADPVWALEAEQSKIQNPKSKIQKLWLLALRSWPGLDDAESKAGAVGLIEAARSAARDADATLQFLPLQTDRDRLWMESGGALESEIIDTSGWHPRRFVEAAAQCDLMIAIRLHALIFAARSSTPCVALNYDPKVAALCELIDAPLLNDLSAPELAKLPAAIAEARPLQENKREAFRDKARRNAELAVGLSA